jgi:hypothetical protein
MRTILYTSVLVAVVLVSANWALAQGHETSPLPAPTPVVIYDHASTLEEGAYRGGADFIRSVGAANYDTSLALMYTQEAYSRYLDNRLKAAATYFDLRQLNREYRAEERGQRPTTEALYHRQRPGSGSPGGEPL